VLQYEVRLGGEAREEGSERAAMRGSGQRAVTPASMINVCPVTQRASSLAR
jgi:hypothetical protein